MNKQVDVYKAHYLFFEDVSFGYEKLKTHYGHAKKFLSEFSIWMLDYYL